MYCANVQLSNVAVADVRIYLDAATIHLQTFSLSFPPFYLVEMCLMRLGGWKAKEGLFGGVLKESTFHLSHGKVQISDFCQVVLLCPWATFKIL